MYRRILVVRFSNFVPPGSYETAGAEAWILTSPTQMARLLFSSPFSMTIGRPLGFGIGFRLGFGFRVLGLRVEGSGAGV